MKTSCSRPAPHPDANSVLKSYWLEALKRLGPLRLQRGAHAAEFSLGEASAYGTSYRLQFGSRARVQPSEQNQNDREKSFVRGKDAIDCRLCHNLPYCV